MIIEMIRTRLVGLQMLEPGMLMDVGESGRMFQVGCDLVARGHARNLDASTGSDDPMIDPFQDPGQYETASFVPSTERAVLSPPKVKARPKAPNASEGQAVSRETPGDTHAAD